MKVIEVVHLVKKFGPLKAVDGISFAVEEGEIFGLIGPNGAGKTTTLRVLATLLTPTSGEARVLGLNVCKDGDRIRNTISYLPEEAGAYRRLRGLDYLNFMGEFYAHDRAEKQAMIARALEVAGLKERIRDRVGTYSKGMVRKLLVARALMHDPKLAILDEPTSGLDVVNSMVVRDIIKGYARKGTTVLLSSHNMLEVEYLSTRVALIDKGLVLEVGTPSELKAKHAAANLEDVFVRAVR